MFCQNSESAKMFRFFLGGGGGANRNGGVRSKIDNYGCFFYYLPSSRLESLSLVQLLCCNECFSRNNQRNLFPSFHMRCKIDRYVTTELHVSNIFFFFWASFMSQTLRKHFCEEKHFDTNDLSVHYEKICCEHWQKHG